MDWREKPHSVCRVNVRAERMEEKGTSIRHKYSLSPSNGQKFANPLNLGFKIGLINHGAI